MKAWELLERDGWCQGSYRNLNGYCALGAIKECYNNSSLDCLCAQDKLSCSLGISIVAWNDNPFRTIEEVISKLKRLDI